MPTNEIHFKNRKGEGGWGWGDSNFGPYANYFPF